MADTAGDDPVRVSAREFLGVGTAVGMGCAIGITLKGNGRHCDHGSFGQPVFQNVIFRLAMYQAEPPTVIVYDDTDVIRVIQAAGALRPSSVAANVIAVAPTMRRRR